MSELRRASHSHTPIVCHCKASLPQSAWSVWYLTCADTCRHKLCASFLLEQGASPYAVDGRAERNALHIAAMGGHSCILEMLINHDVKATILRRRVGTRCFVDRSSASIPLNLCKALCSKASLLSVLPQLPLQPSLAAPQTWALNVLQHHLCETLPRLDRYNLLSRYIDGQAANGETALHMATAVGNTACIEVLLAAGASMAVQTTSPMTATSHLLGMSGAIIFLQGSTSLHIAAQCNRTAIIRLLLKVSIQQNSNHCRTSFGFLGSFAPALVLFISTGFEYLHCGGTTRKSHRCKSDS